MTSLARLLALGVMLGGLAQAKQSVSLEWDPSPASEEVSGYKVYFGTSRSKLSLIATLGLVAQTTVSDLADGQRYYFGVTSTNAEGLESRLSNIVATEGEAAPELQVRPLRLIKGESVLVTSAEIEITDDDTRPEDLIVTVSGVIGGGFFVNGIATEQFTKAQLDQGLVTFVHDGSLNEPFFLASVSDGSHFAEAPGLFVFTPNRKPSLFVKGLAVTEGDRLLLAEDLFTIIDEDSQGFDFSFSVAGEKAGQILLKDLPSRTFRLSDLRQGSVAFLHDGSETDGSFSLSVSDGTADSPPVVVSVQRIPVNDPPSLQLKSIDLQEARDIVLSPSVVLGADEETPLQSLRYLVTDLQNGELLVNGQPASEFTQEQLEAGQVVLTVKDALAPPSLKLAVDDGTISTQPQVLRIGIVFESKLSVSLKDDIFRFDFATRPGFKVVLEESLDLVNWTNTGEFIAPDNGVATLSGPFSLLNQLSRRYFRLKVTPP